MREYFIEALWACIHRLQSQRVVSYDWWKIYLKISLLWLLLLMFFEKLSEENLGKYVNLDLSLNWFRSGLEEKFHWSDANIIYQGSHVEILEYFLLQGKYVFSFAEVNLMIDDLLIFRVNTLPLTFRLYFLKFVFRSGKNNNWVSLGSELMSKASPDSLWWTSNHCKIFLSILRRNLERIELLREQHIILSFL